MSAIEKIKQQVSENPVMLYMKGTPDMPMCGFSSRTVDALQLEMDKRSGILHPQDRPRCKNADHQECQGPLLDDVCRRDLQLDADESEQQRKSSRIISLTSCM